MTPIYCQCNCDRPSVWQDNEVLDQVDRDVKRTHPDMHFFSGDDPSAIDHRLVRSFSDSTDTTPNPGPCRNARR